MKVLTFGELVGRPECYYLRRWVLNLGFISFRLHHWFKSDDQRNFHDHAWWFWTFILKGSYEDITPSGVEVMKPGMARFRNAEHKHAVKVAPNGCWSFMVTGPAVRTWGFWVGTKFKKANKYFFRHGHHQCD